MVGLAGSRRIVAPLFVLTGMFMLKKASNKLSLWAHNNYMSDKTWDWGKELVVITGGCGGIGALVVSQLAAKNIKVVILDIVEPKTKLEANCVFYKVDITSNEEIHATAEKIRAEHGDPTVLINNAGFGTATPLLQISENMIRKAFDVNIVSHFLLVKEFLPAMVDRNHGHIVTVASMGSFMTQASNVDYACTKAATLAFHEGINQELKILYKAPSVRTTIIHPSWVRTPMTSKLSNNPAFKDSILEPEDVAHAIVSQILSGYGAQIILPASGSWVSSVRGFPLWLQEKLRTQVSLVLTDAMKR
ncbi:hypothetical protein N7509_008244 [Penicillium cosmopolitanum]|uniref:Short-chain dehydrogenase/reductase 3 n=1 Tax=Penicillium cosmopolitanum TaxID=1131564 RepID=A0A9W9VM80_9EURO|nr:uncharacterized protein N7509_008244 [Penicillium cosmopolitanum]KAJ5385703.1 hypothetical protein N7509_008244 [Penicillium cosmopolitanum]